jgi:FtsH-binding integral membrane protein
MAASSKSGNGLAVVGFIVGTLGFILMVVDHKAIGTALIVTGIVLVAAGMGIGRK